MRKIFYCAILFSGFLLISPALRANNVAVSNAGLAEKDAVADTMNVKFDISWDNSWRTPGAPSATANWDAAWVFVKYSVYSAGVWSDWNHATLSANTASYNIPAGSAVSVGTTGGAGKGVFIYRSNTNENTGSVSWPDVKLVWNYGTDGVADNAVIKAKVFAIEMVFVPAGSFSVGDVDKSAFNCFYEGGTTHEFLITSEDTITVGDVSGSLYYTNSTTYGGDRAGPIPVTFPKGYNAFYMMKYEISQKQYCEFLNILTPTQAGNRWDSFHYGQQRDFIKKASNGKFGCDGNNNAGAYGSADFYKMNESNDGEWIASRVSYPDVAAYADWSGLNNGLPRGRQFRRFRQDDTL